MAFLVGLERQPRKRDDADSAGLLVKSSHRLSFNQSARLLSMSADSTSDESTALVHEGWSHLQSQRPLAAWGSWQRALRAEPKCAAARQALATLESAADLPQAARIAYRFRQPEDSRRRAVWDERMQGKEPDDLAASADLFGRLAIDEPFDSAAWYNRALCLAWQGENPEAISCLDRVISIDAERAWEKAVGAGTLAGILRQGAGAEELADDLRYACTIAWEPAETGGLLDEFPEIQRTAAPREPGKAHDPETEVEVFEWLDRPLATLLPAESQITELPRVLASVYIDRQRHRLRLSSPRVENLERIEELLSPRYQLGARSVRREVTPLPLPFLDADVWTFRTPPNLDPGLADDLRREAVEQYYENEWIHRRRQSLGDRSPLALASAAFQGDLVAKAKLAAAVSLREQLGERPSARRLYHGYPFDRLRRRLALDSIDSGTVDPADLGCAAPRELDQLDPAVLDTARLIEAVRSSAGLADDKRTARLAAELLGRKPALFTNADLLAAVAPLVRQSLRQQSFDSALDWIERAKAAADGETRRKLDIWRAEIHARAGRSDSALSIYLGLVTSDAAGAALALDGAETLIDQGHKKEAERLLVQARDLARKTGRRWIERRAQQLL
jgi:tetratricopeptide (TPR) repeat protein